MKSKIRRIVIILLCNMLLVQTVATGLLYSNGNAIEVVEEAVAVEEMTIEETATEEIITEETIVAEETTEAEDKKLESVEEQTGLAENEKSEDEKIEEITDEEEETGTEEKSEDEKVEEKTEKTEDLEITEETNSEIEIEEVENQEEAPEVVLGVVSNVDLKDMSFSATDIITGRTVKFDGSSKKPAVILFGGLSSCGITISAIRKLNMIVGQTDVSKYDIYLFDIKDNSSDSIRREANYDNWYGGYNVMHCDKSYNNAARTLYRRCLNALFGAYSTISYTMPLIVYKGSDGKIYAGSTGSISESDIMSNLNKIGIYEKSSSYNPIVEGWRQDGDKWWYQNADGTYPTSMWKEVEGKWYYFDSNGYMRTGWLYEAGKWYYLDASGRMQTGWVCSDGKWYYFESNGVMAVNKWIDNTFYVKSNGVMAVNEWINDKYYVGADGRWVQGKQKIVAGWKQDKTGWWYQNADGTYPKSCWKEIGGKWYHFNASGYMQTGWIYVNSYWFFLEPSGAMATNKWIQDKYFVKSNGAMAVNEWVDGGKYYVDGNGVWVPGKVK